MLTIEDNSFRDRIKLACTTIILKKESEVDLTGKSISLS